MSKKRKKHYQPGMQKVLQAQHRNDYFKRLGIFLKDLTGEDVLALIPSEERERLYTLRNDSITVEAQNGHDISPDLINSIKGVVNGLIKTLPPPIEMVNQNVKLSQYYTFGRSLCDFVKHLDEVGFKNSGRVKDLLIDHFGNTREMVTMLLQEINQSVLLCLAMATNNYCYGYHLFSIEVNKEKKFQLRFVIRVKKNPPEKIRIVINNNPRTVYRVGWAMNDHFEWINVTPDKLGIKNKLNDPIPVYIQRHTWNRLLERLDCLSEDSFTLCIFFSLTYCKAIRDKDNFLIEFTVGDVKAGYLVALLINGKLIIRTFLFLTCAGTPEGNRLEELAGLKRLDTKYLKMDKLSTFMSEKISTNKEVRAIFKKADCLHLLDLFDKLEMISEHTENSQLDAISNYLRTNNVKLPEWELEEEEEQNNDKTIG